MYKYEVKWVGSDELTWEPEDHLDSCPEKLEEFRKEQVVTVLMCAVICQLIEIKSLSCKILSLSISL